MLQRKVGLPNCIPVSIKVNKNLEIFKTSALISNQTNQNAQLTNTQHAAPKQQTLMLLRVWKHCGSHAFSASAFPVAPSVAARHIARPSEWQQNV